MTAPGATTAGFAPLAIGLTLTVIHLISIPVSGTSVNPARSIATAIYGADWTRAELWVFIIVPVVGGLIAGYTWKFLFSHAAVGRAWSTTRRSSPTSPAWREKLLQRTELLLRPCGRFSRHTGV